MELSCKGTVEISKLCRIEVGVFLYSFCILCLIKVCTVREEELKRIKLDVLAIELFNAAQALEFRRPLRSSWSIEKIFAKYRKVVPFIDDDRYMHPLIEKSVEFIR